VGALGVVDGGQRGTDRGQCRVGAESGRCFHVFTVEIGTTEIVRMFDVFAEGETGG